MHFPDPLAPVCDAGLSLPTCPGWCICRAHWCHAVRATGRNGGMLLGVWQSGGTQVPYAWLETQLWSAAYQQGGAAGEKPTLLRWRAINATWEGDTDPQESWGCLCCTQG